MGILGIYSIVFFPLIFIVENRKIIFLKSGGRSQTQFQFIKTFLNLRGLPPFIGFFIKLIILIRIVPETFFFKISIIFLVLNLVIVFYYFQIIFLYINFFYFIKNFFKFKKFFFFRIFNLIILFIILT